MLRIIIFPDKALKRVRQAGDGGITVVVTYEERIGHTIVRLTRQGNI